MPDAKLDSYLSNYGTFNNWLIERRYAHLKQFFKGETCLEVGCAGGKGTKHLLDHFRHVTIVDGSKEAVESVARRLANPRLSVVHTYFEDMELGGQRFDTIVLAHILEHVDTPLVVLERAKSCLGADGVIIIDVPNGNSLHRQIGVEMGLLTEKTQLNEADLSIGHQRVYVPETFKKEVVDAGLGIQEFGGMFVKVLSNVQTEKVFNEEQLEALFTVGSGNPEIAAEMYVVAKLAQQSP